MSQQLEPTAAITRINETLYRVSLGLSPYDSFESRSEAEDALRGLGEQSYTYCEPSITKTIVLLTD